MNAYSPVENVDRLKEGILAVVAGRTIEFAKASNDLIVVFDSPFDKFSTGRILLFQQYFMDRTGILPEIIKQVPACVKVFFNLGMTDDKYRTKIWDTLNSNEAFAIYKSLRISQLQFGGRMIPEHPLKFSQQMISPDPRL